jgi:large subunit ribosomal protein L22
MKVTAHLANAHVTPRKARLVAGLIRGLDVAQARIQLEKSIKKTSSPLLKLLESAIANAENNFSLSKESLWVASCDVNEGQKLKRWIPRAQGRATPLWHRLCHISIVLEGVAAKSATKKKAIVKEEETETKKVASKPARAKKIAEKSE